MSGILSQTTQLQLAADVAAPRIALVAEADFSSTGIFRCYADCDAVVLASLAEPLRLLGRNIPEDVTEYLDFALTARAALSSPVVGPPAASWVGKDCGEIAVRGGEVVVPGPVLGVAKVVYRTQYSRWRLPASALSLPRVLVLAMCREALASLGFTPETVRNPERGASLAIPADWSPAFAGVQLTYSNPTDESAAAAAQPTRYVLTVVDHCTGDPVPGAMVSTTYGRGQADENGQVEIGPIPSGARVELYVTAPGYQDTRLDSLNNDHFIA
ncbi:peptidase associated/transthyretin-like domain-containing protein [Megalodesulfovibrio gigas]|uniref:Carboxypeptidase regulatory-like domain-containing protein n=1 Tax=Megalodesulfovibrio gigas (strain ATCC 19364 / DSM 1382 / NCIMB 9332 / VKM B-1759) TaxID=1121448 RepID=T2G6A9_MEGG1|nr:hypothetical protein [Megalodesulfovibrio gigas]AGW12095.1 hypothetical protein DGI_0158 [Megalodesulfovibrio gigas DSM 1382 = ATCC 19364]